MSDFDLPATGYWGNTSNWADILADYNANVPQMMMDAKGWQATQDPSGISVIPQTAIHPELMVQVDPAMPNMWANPDLTYNMPMISQLPDPNEFQKYNYSNIPLIEYQEVTLPIATAVQKASRGGGRTGGIGVSPGGAPRGGHHRGLDFGGGEGGSGMGGGDIGGLGTGHGSGGHHGGVW